MSAYLAELAWLGGPAATADVLVEVDAGVVTGVRTGVTQPPPGIVRLPGLTLPGLADAHCHAFHRALRGRTGSGAGDFWAWRERMYAAAAVLTPDGYHRLARAVYGELALAGVTCVGEFHYLHHGPDGRPYDDPNAMGEALLAAAADAGVRLTLLDACYLAGGPGLPLHGVQRRFGDRDAAGWVARVGALRMPAHARLGAAVHSVRAVPPRDAHEVAAYARGHGLPLHAHVSEQRAENEACLAATGRTPTALLDAVGALGPGATAVHATHLTAADLGLLAGTGTGVCLCPTTERDLADGIGPGGALAAARVPLSLGSDSNAVTDLLEEARLVELHERLATGRRGTFPAAALLTAATSAGHAALGWPEAGTIEVGAPADLVTVSLDGPRLAGLDDASVLDGVLLSVTAADVRHVVAGGRVIVSGGRHVLLGDVAGLLRAAVREVLA